MDYRRLASTFELRSRYEAGCRGSSLQDVRTCRTWLTATFPTVHTRQPFQSRSHFREKRRVLNSPGQQYVVVGQTQIIVTAVVASTLQH